MIFNDIAAIGTVMATNLITIITLYIHLDNKTKQSMEHIDGKMRAHEDRTALLIGEIQKEMKDFHGRLCAIEERNKKDK